MISYTLYVKNKQTPYLFLEYLASWSSGGKREKQIKHLKLNVYVSFKGPNKNSL